MLKEKDYCDYEICVALKELGYPIDWFEDETYHENSTNIQLYEAQKWLREEKNVSISVMPSLFGYFASIYINFKKDKSSANTKYIWDTVLYPSNTFDNYEESLLDAIKYTITYLK